MMTEEPNGFSQALMDAFESGYIDKMSKLRKEEDERRMGKTDSTKKINFDKNKLYTAPSGLGGSFSLKFQGYDSETKTYNFRVQNPGFNQKLLKYSRTSLNEVKEANIKTKNKQDIKFGIFQMPTKEAKTFLNRKPELVSELYDKSDDKLKSLLEDFQKTGFMDEMISHYEIKSVKTESVENNLKNNNKMAKKKEQQMTPEHEREQANKQMVYLAKQMLYIGFAMSELQKQALADKINSNEKSFTLEFTSDKANFGNKMDYQLNFNRSDKGGVFLNSFDGKLTKNNGEELTHRFAVNQQSSITAKEALNLMEGRAVKTGLADKETGELSPAFVKLKLNEEKTDYGNFKIEVYNEKYGVDTRKIVENSPLMFEKDEYKDNTIKALEKGNIVKVKFENEGKTVHGKAVLNPQYKTINLYDSYMNRLNTNKPTQGLEQEQSESKAQVKQQKASRSM